MTTTLRRYLIVLLALAALPLTTAGACGSDSGGSAPEPGNTLVIVGTNAATLTCTYTPYDYALSAQEPHGTGVSVIHGLVRGSMWVACTGGEPDTFEITITLLRNGVPYGKPAPYTGIPTIVGYEASSFNDCLPGVYRVQYSVKWTFAGAIRRQTTTVPLSQEVSQHDCDAS